MNKFIDFKIINSLSLDAGFQGCGAVKAKQYDISSHFNWLNKGYNAEMQYLKENIDKRENPSLLANNTKSIISFIASYNTQEIEDINTNKEIEKGHNLRFASYSYFNDYHKVIKQALYRIISSIQETYPDFEGRVFVDSAPYSEKMIAKEAGLGFIGRNSLLINKVYGSKILIGEIITNYSTNYNTFIEEDLCGDCILCIEACPNKAIEDNRTINSNLCSSYQNMAKKGDIDKFIALNNYIYGCDICLDACPWNRKAKIIKSKLLELNTNMQELNISINNKEIDKSLFNRAKKKGAIENIKFQKLLSNIQKAKKDSTNK